MEKLAKSVGWILTVAAAHLAFIIGWTLALGIGGALWFSASFALIDWMTGIARWENGYAAHLGQIAATLMTGLAIPAGAVLAAWRFAKKKSRTFNLYGLSDGARIAIRILCFAVAAILIVVPLYLAGGQAFRAFETVYLSGAASDERLTRLLRGVPLFLFAMAVMEWSSVAATDR